MADRFPREWYDKPNRVSKYYCNRLDQISCYAKKVGSRACFIESDSLIDATDDILNGLTQWLQLSNKLENRYQHFDATGREGVGDSSQNIMNNKIISTHSCQSITLPDEVIGPATESFQQCLDVLRKHCIDIAS